MADPAPVPKGLVFFTPGIPPARRRKRLAFVTILFMAALALVWPVYALFSSTYPLLLGLPLSLVWPIGWLLVMFTALAWLYRTDHRQT